MGTGLRRCDLREGRVRPPRIDPLAFATPGEKGVEWLRPRPSSSARRSSRKSIAPSRSPRRHPIHPCPGDCPLLRFRLRPRFRFYSGLKGSIYHYMPGTSCLSISERARVMHGASSGHASSSAFPSVGAKIGVSFSMMAYEWVFLVELVGRKQKEPNLRLPRLLLAAGKAPAREDVQTLKTSSAPSAGDRRGIPFQAATSAGRRPRNGVAFSKASAMRSTVGS